MSTLSHRKIQLDDQGWLAANQNVSIPPESSKNLTAINTSFNEQAGTYTKEWQGIMGWLAPEATDSKNYLKRYFQISNALRDLTNGYLSTEEAFEIITNTPTN